MPSSVPRVKGAFCLIGSGPKEKDYLIVINDICPFSCESPSSGHCLKRACLKLVLALLALTSNKSPEGFSLSATTSSRYSPSIDGLRAVAVLLVLGVHLFPEWVKGGFVGVDIFFVISGYLISGLLFKDLAQDHFSLRHFYARRIRRIFPALSTVLLACLGIGWFLLPPQEYQELGKHVAGGAGFIANLLLWQESGYFDGVAKTKILLHLWSLGIEEQFYIFWPLLLFVTRKGRRRIPLTLGAVIVFSFVFNVVWIHKDSVATFYAPLTRVWELALGGFLAWSLRYDQGGPHPKRQAWCQIFGLVLLSAAVALLDEKSLFPGWWALLPTLGAMAIIAAGDGAWFNRWVLSNPLAVGIGVISYPLYLWHWPLLVFARQSQLDITSPRVRLSLVGASFVLATLTYFLVEKPIRFGRSYPRARVIGLACVMAVIGLTGLGLYQNGGAPGRFSPAL